MFVDDPECYSWCGIQLRCCRLRYHSLSRIAITRSRVGCIYFFSYYVATRFKSSVSGNEMGLRILAFFCVSTRHEKRTRCTKTYYGSAAIRLTRWCTTSFSFDALLMLLLSSVVWVLLVWNVSSNAFYSPASSVCTSPLMLHVSIVNGTSLSFIVLFTLLLLLLLLFVVVVVVKFVVCSSSFFSSLLLLLLVLFYVFLYCWLVESVWCSVPEYSRLYFAGKVVAIRVNSKLSTSCESCCINMPCSSRYAKVGQSWMSEVQNDNGVTVSSVLWREWSSALMWMSKLSRPLYEERTSLIYGIMRNIWIAAFM